jgi:hypothetical protein
MKFIVSRTSMWHGEKPCEEAKKEKATYFTDSFLKTVKEAIKKHEWIRKGNPVQMKGFVRVYDKEPEDVWTIEIKTLEAFIEFVNKYGDIVFKKSRYKEIPFEIEIYDDYRE